MVLRMDDALGRAARLQGRAARGERGGGGRHQVGDVPRRRRERLRALLGREGRAPARAAVAVRLRQPPPDVVRRRRGRAGRRGGRRRRDRGRRPAGRHLPRVGRRRPARQQDRLGGADHAQAERDRRAVPERALAVGEPRDRDGDAALEADRARRSASARRRSRASAARRRTSTSARRSAPTSCTRTRWSRTTAPTSRSATPNGVLDGDLDGFVRAWLEANAKALARTERRRSSRSGAGRLVLALHAGRDGARRDRHVRRSARGGALAGVATLAGRSRGARRSTTRADRRRRRGVRVGGGVRRRAPSGCGSLVPGPPGGRRPAARRCVAAAVARHRAGAARAPFMRQYWHPHLLRAPRRGLRGGSASAWSPRRRRARTPSTTGATASRRGRGGGARRTTSATTGVASRSPAGPAASARLHGDARSSSHVARSRLRPARRSRSVDGACALRARAAARVGRGAAAPRARTAVELEALERRPAPAPPHVRDVGACRAERREVVAWSHQHLARRELRVRVDAARRRLVVRGARARSARAAS